MANDIQMFHRPTRKNVVLNMMRAVASKEDVNKINSMAWKMMYYFLYLVDNQNDSISESALKGESYIEGQYDDFINLIGSDNPNSTRINSAAKTLAGFVGQVRIGSELHNTTLFKDIVIDQNNNKIKYLVNEVASSVTLQYRDTLLIDPLNACRLSSLSTMRLYEIYKQTIYTGPLIFDGDNMCKDIQKLLFLKSYEWNSIKKFFVSATKEINKQTEIEGIYETQSKGKSHKITKLTLSAVEKTTYDLQESEIKEGMGKFKNVYLSKKELEEVKEWFPQEYDLKIDYLSLEIKEQRISEASTAYNVLLRWYLNEEARNRKTNQSSKHQGRPKKAVNPNEGKGLHEEFTEAQIKKFIQLAEDKKIPNIEEYLNRRYKDMCEYDPKSGRFTYLKKMIINDKSQDALNQRKGNYFVESNMPHLSVAEYEAVAKPAPDEDDDDDVQPWHKKETKE